MAIGSSLGITLPTQGSNTNTWGTDLNTELQKVIDAVEGQVPISAIDFTSDLAAGDNGITGLDRTQYNAQGSNPTDLRCVFFTSSGEFAVRDGANNVVTLTSSGALNAAASNGLTDTGGTYGSSGIALDWNGSKYDFLDGVGTYADVRANKLELHDNTANSVTIDVPTVSSSYNLTLPSAVAASTGLFLQSDSSGNCSWSNSTTQDVDTGNLDVTGTIGSTGTATFGGLTTVSGGGISLGSNLDILLQGTGVVRHGEYTIFFPAAMGAAQNGSTDMGDYFLGSAVGAQYWEAPTISSEITIPVLLKAGDRIKQIEVHFVGDDTTSKTFYLIEYDPSLATATQVGTEATTTSGYGTVTIDSLSTSSQLPLTMDAGKFVAVTFNAARAGDRVYGIDVTYDRP